MFTVNEFRGGLPSPASASVASPPARGVSRHRRARLLPHLHPTLRYRGVAPLRRRTLGPHISGPHWHHSVRGAWCRGGAPEEKGTPPPSATTPSRMSGRGPGSQAPCPSGLYVREVDQHRPINGTVTPGERFRHHPGPEDVAFTGAGIFLANQMSPSEASGYYPTPRHVRSEKKGPTWKVVPHGDQAWFRRRSDSWLCRHHWLLHSGTRMVLEKRPKNGQSPHLTLTLAPPQKFVTQTLSSLTDLDVSLVYSLVALAIFNLPRTSPTLRQSPSLLSAYKKMDPATTLNTGTSIRSTLDASQ